MPGKTHDNFSSFCINQYPVVDTRDCYTCSFKEFLPFNSGMYYYSSFKAFKTITPA